MARCSLHLLERVAAAPFARATRLTLLAGFLVTATTAAQTITIPVTFTTSGQNLWGPGTTPLADFDHTLNFAVVSWDVAGSTPGVQDVGGFSFGADIGASSSGGFGVSARFANFTGGDVNVTYPVAVTLGLPDPNSFRDGQTVHITSSLAVQPDAAITTTPYGADIYVGGKAGIAAAANARLCFFDCVSVPLFPPVDIGFPNLTLFALGVHPDGQSFASIGGQELTLPHTLTFSEEQITNLSGTVGLPSVHPLTTIGTDGRTIVAVGRDTFVDLRLNLDGFFTGKIPLGFQTPEIHGVQVGYETVDFSGVLKVWQHQEFSFTATVFATLTFPQTVEFSEQDADGNVLRSGTADVVTFEVGHSLSVVYPVGLKEPMNIVPSFSIASNRFATSTSIASSEDLVLTVGKFLLTVPSVTVIPASTVDACYAATVDADFLDIIPDESCPVTTPALISPAINVNLGPLYQKNLLGAGQDLPVFPLAASDCSPGSAGCGRWELAGFNQPTGAVFQLDPENPMVALETSFASGLATGTGPAGTITQTILVTNAGDVPLSAAQIQDALNTAIPKGSAFSVIHTMSPDLTENTAFNGVADLNTLTGGDVLAVGVTGQLTINIAATPHNLFTSELSAGGTSPAGVTVGASAAAGIAVFATAHAPPSIPLPGPLTVAVVGNPVVDATLIDPSSVRLEGVAPLSWSVLTASSSVLFRFDRLAVLAAWQRRLAGPPPLVPVVAAPDPAIVALALLDERVALSSVQLHAADVNTNGRLDVGDLRALVIGLRATPGTPPTPGPVPAPPDMISVSSPPNLLILTGRLMDGTPFMGDDRLPNTRTGGAP